MSDTPLLRLYVWPHRILYLGLSPDNEMHRHHAAQICVSLDGALRIDSGSEFIESAAVVVPPDHTHRISAGDARILSLYLEPESDEFESLMAPLITAADSDQLSSLDLTSDAMASLRELYDAGEDADRIWTICITALGMGSSTISTTERDARIERVVDIIRGEPSASHAVDRLAEAVHLSPGRLSHLFRQEIGVPIRRFTVWSRIRKAVQLAGEGAALTEAAHAAGFSDAAHMSNTFRQMFGFAPSALFAKQIPIDIRFLE